MQNRKAHYKEVSKKRKRKKKRKENKKMNKLKRKTGKGNEINFFILQTA